MIKKYLLVLSLILGAFIGGTFYKRQSPGEKIVYKDRIQTVIRTVKPDGTVIEERRTEDRSGTKTIVKLPTYSLGIFAVKDFNKKITDMPDYGASVGYRLLGNFWAESSFLPSQKIFTLGLRLEL
jgi:hypothetical protein